MYFLHLCFYYTRIPKGAQQSCINATIAQLPKYIGKAKTCTFYAISQAKNILNCSYCTLKITERMKEEGYTRVRCITGHVRSAVKK